MKLLRTLLTIALLILFIYFGWTLQVAVWTLQAAVWCKVLFFFSEIFTITVVAQFIHQEYKELQELKNKSNKK